LEKVNNSYEPTTDAKKTNSQGLNCIRPWASETERVQSNGLTFS